MGAEISGIGTHDIVVSGRPLHGAEHTVTSDYLEAGFFALAGLIRGGDLKNGSRSRIRKPKTFMNSQQEAASQKQGSGLEKQTVRRVIGLF